jgi:hypothetical protein
MFLTILNEYSVQLCNNFDKFDKCMMNGILKCKNKQKIFLVVNWISMQNMLKAMC